MQIGCGFRITGKCVIDAQWSQFTHVRGCRSPFEEGSGACLGPVQLRIQAKIFTCIAHEPVNRHKPAAANV